LKHEGISYSCDQCGNKLTSRKGLKYHIESMHDGISYSCDKCGHKVTIRYGLKCHIKSNHGSISFPCDQCEYKSPSKGGLQYTLFFYKNHFCPFLQLSYQFVLMFCQKVRLDVLINFVLIKKKSVVQVLVDIR